MKIKFDRLLEQARTENPSVAYTGNEKQTLIAAWDQGRWIVVAALGIDGHWYSVESELFVDGKPVWKQGDFVEVEMTEEQRTHGMEVMA